MDHLSILQNHFLNMPFNHKMAAEYGISKNVIHSMLKAGIIARVYRGIYALTDTELDQEFYFRCATLKAGDESYISTISAYIYYELSDHVGRKVWISVHADCRRNEKWLRTIRVRNLYPEIGITKKTGYRISNIERTIVDGFRYQKLVGLRQAADAYKNAILKKRTTPARVYEMAGLLRAEKSVKPFIEIL